MTNFLIKLCSWVNNWCAKVGDPAFLDSDNLKKTKLIKNNVNPCLIGSYQAAINLPSNPYGPDAKNRACKLHKAHSYFFIPVAI